MKDTYVYRLYDADGALLYIGATNNVRRRLGQHRRDRPDDTGAFAQHDTEGPYEFREARRVERLSIRHERPRFNIHLNIRLVNAYP